MKITGNAYAFLVALVAAAGGFLFGFDLSIASGALPFPGRELTEGVAALVELGARHRPPHAGSAI